MAVGGLFIAINVVVGIWGLWTWRRSRPVTPLLSQLLALSHTLALLQGAFGLYLLAGGYRAPVAAALRLRPAAVRRRALRLFGAYCRRPAQPAAILHHRVRHRRPRNARLHDREGDVTLRSTLWRNLAIVGLVAAALTAAGEGGSEVTGILFLILRVAFLVALAWLALDGLAAEPRHVPAHAGALAGDALRLGHRDRAAGRDGGPVGELLAARRRSSSSPRSAAAATCSTAAGRSRAATTTEAAGELCEYC